MSEKLDAIRARWDVAKLAPGELEVAQARKDTRDLLEIVQRAEALLDALDAREQIVSHAARTDLGNDVWVDDVTTSDSEVLEARAALAEATGWSTSLQVAVLPDVTEHTPRPADAVPPAVRRLRKLGDR